VGWGTLYLRLVRRVRLARLAVAVLGVASVFLWSPLAGGALVGLLAILLLEGWLFGRRVHRALGGDSGERSLDDRR
jgi:cobalamin synthase